MLCQTRWGTVLSTSQSPQFDPGAAANSSFLQGCLCGQSNTMQRLNSDGINDLSMCNVQTNGVDLVYSRETLWVSNTGLAWWEYSLLCVICIFCIRSFNQMLQQQFVDDYRMVLGAVACILVLCVRTGTIQYVTREDLLGFCLVVLYMVLEIGVYLLRLSWRPSYNIMLVSFLLVAVRLYGSIRTPYNIFLLWAVGTRFFMKLHSQTDSHLLRFSLLLDSGVLSILAVLGSSYDPMVNLTVLFFSLVTSDALEQKPIAK